MFEVLDHVREKPQQERKAIALFLSVGVTAVIFVVWAISFFAFTDRSTPTQTVTEGGFGFGSFMDSFQEASSALKQEVGTAREQLEQINAELNDSEGETHVEVDGADEVARVPQETEITESGIEIIRIEP
ncbi:MAG: hypothetical protein WD509_02615 [Candidatus Paceibacterota bacterium]